MLSLFLPLLGSYAIATATPGPIPLIARDGTRLARRADDNATTYAGITSVTVTSDRQSYFTVLKLGEVNYRVALDTASSDLWIMSSDCATEACNDHPRLPLAYQSPTFSSVNDNQTAYRVSYFDGTAASGFVAREQTMLANLTVQNQEFGLVQDTNVTMVDETSGILGLGFPRLSSISSSVANSTPFFPGLAQDGLLDYPLFGLSLTNNESGTLAIGAVDAAVVTNVSDIHWNPVVEFRPLRNESEAANYLHWAIPIDHVAVNGTEVDLRPTYPRMTNNASLALIDVGSAGIYGPYQDVARIFDQVDGARLVDTDNGLWAVPCDTTENLAFAFGEQNYTLQPTDYLIGPAQGNPNFCLSWPQAHPPSSDGIDWQIGATFLRTVYSIFSFGIDGKQPPMVGFYIYGNTSNVTQTPESISSYFNSVSATIGTTLPNAVLPTPTTLTTPSYIFNTSVDASTGGIVESGLANSTYSPILQAPTNLSAIPLITPTPSALTFVVTSGGQVVTSTFTAPTESAGLGVVPGWNAASSLYVNARTSLAIAFGAFVSLCVQFSWT